MLTEENAHSFWNAAWGAQCTGWRGGEVIYPFFRNIYLFLASMQADKGKRAVHLPHDARPLGLEGNKLFSGPAEEEAVRAYIAGKCVLVPLCGDTPALAFFVSQGAKMVVGADLSAESLAAQRRSHFPGTDFTQSVLQEGAPADRVVLYEATVKGTTVRLFEGDFLRLWEVPAFASVAYDFVYDRAAFMAINPALRAAYVRTVSKVLKPETPLLVERPVRGEGDTAGPPFTFTVESLKTLYEAATGRTFDVESILQFKWGETRPNSPNWMEFIAVRPSGS